MDDRRALMAAIIANPDEDTPRLALADWLQEHGDTHDRARAEFIRAQIESAAGGNNPRAALKHIEELHQAHAKHWLGPLWELSKSESGRAFTRGIVMRWFTTPGEFLKKASQAACVERFPLLGVNELALYDNTKRVEALTRSPAIGWITTLFWHDAKIEDDGFAALATSPHTSRLSQLTIDKPRCTDAGLKAFAKSEGYPNLHTFGLRDGLWRGKFSAAGVRLILDSDRFPRLVELDLSGAHRHAVTQRTLYMCGGLSRLRILRVGFDTDMKALARCPHLTNLEELYVADSTLDDGDAHVLADNPAFKRLKVIALTDMNSYHSPLGAAAEKVLRDRFGHGLTLKYSILCRRD